jgi:P-type E1-E2 ATPase
MVIEAQKNEKGSKLSEYATFLLLNAETVVMYRSSPSQKA